jgi:nucleotide-binding universal stress UspA family protein
MYSIQTVLHPTDFSDRSRYAFQLACSFARDYGARLTILHVAEALHIVHGEGVLPLNLEEMRIAAQEQLDQFQVPHANVRAERRLEQGDAVAEILRVAQEIHADLIVMSTHGRTGLGRLLMGSVAEQVMRQAPCPVVIVKASSSAAEPGQDISESVRRALMTPHA